MKQTGNTTSKIRNLILGVVLLCSFSFATIPLDKQAHFALSYIGVDVLTELGVPRPVASLGVLLVGIFKEYVNDKVPDEGDLAADIAGVLLWNIVVEL